MERKTLWDRTVDLTIRVGERILAPIERFIGKRSLVGDATFFPLERFPWVEHVEANWEVIRWLSMPPWPYALDDAHEFIRKQLDQDLGKTTFALMLGDALVGAIDVRMNPSSHSQSGPGPNLGYWLGRRYWGCGYMTEAAKGFIAHVFATIPDDALYSGAFADNAASLRIQEKLGFTRDGDAALFSNPHGKEMPHVGTVLTRAAFERLYFDIDSGLHVRSSWLLTAPGKNLFRPIAALALPNRLVLIGKVAFAPVETRASIK